MARGLDLCKFVHFLLNDAFSLSLQTMHSTKLRLSFLGLSILLTFFGCHSAPPPAPPPPPPEPEPVDTEPQIPEVVKNELDLTGNNFAGCELFPEAAENIWGYRVQADLNLSVQVYEGKIDAADAEKLMNILNAFTKEWKGRFATLCEHSQKEFLAPGQYEEAVQCLSDLLARQKDYVNELFFKKQFDIDDAAAVAAHINDCDAVLDPKGEKALMQNPF